MDPTTATVIAAAVGVAGAILGALINQLGAGRVAERTLRGQRQLALDAAERQWRADMVQPLLSHMSTRIDGYGGVWDAITSQDQTATDAAWQRVGPPSSAMRNSAWDAVPDTRFREAATRAVNADVAVSKRLHQFQATPLLARLPASDAVGEALNRLGEAIRDVYGAADSYVHALPATESERKLRWPSWARLPGRK